MLLSLPSILGYYQQLPLISACMDFEGMFKTSPADSEFVTRKEIIDRRLKDAGWKIVRFDAGKSLGAFDRCAIEEYPTEAGPADYALCIRGEILRIKKPTLHYGGYVAIDDRP